MQTDRAMEYQYDQEHYIEGFEGHQIWYGELGCGKRTFVLIDGIACMGYAFRYLKEYYAKDIRIIHPHYRGHGKTTSGPYDRLSINMLVQDIKAVIDHAGAENVVLIAHSMGVQVIFEYYRQYQEDVAALIPICGGFGSIMEYYHNTNKMELPSRLIINQILKPYRKIPMMLFHKIVSSALVRKGTMLTEVNGKVLHEEDMAIYFDDIKYHLDLKAFGYLLESAMDHSTLDMLPDVNVPVLIIAGQEDRMTPPELSIQMAGMIPGAKLFILPWGSHTVPLEQPDMTNLLIDDFLIENALK